MDMMAIWRRAIAAQPHPVTVSGGVITFETDMAGKIQVTGAGAITVAGRNLYDYTQCKNDYLLNPQGGEQASTTGWAISPYIKVDGLEKVTYFNITTPGSNPHSVWYKADKTIHTVFKQATGRNTLTVPEGAVYVRFSLMHGTSGQNPDRNSFCLMPGETDAAFEAYSGSSEQVSHPGFNTVWSDSGDITVTYWKH